MGAMAVAAGGLMHNVIREPNINMRNIKDYKEMRKRQHNIANLCCNTCNVVGYCDTSLPAPKRQLLYS